ncbi:ribosomal protein S16 domain-containing protein [Tricharina praecox]|uniref:ribosomal protein S16 domain-containing protein n=1 Tax=Tricharina praecox TaxID=43433 RepID=UPI00221E93B0|nr:ribosomal protein S16 domain-containing protein [Tricharina praecox]KAI5856428.1 ribosomal protein S16 domain-containing protein [Tricharina praecox]
MVIRLRLARFGRRHAPVYNIVVCHARTARNSKPIEVIGTYDPIAKPPIDGAGKPVKDIQLDTTRAKYWLGVGAQPSDTVWRLMSMFGLIEPQWQIQRILAAGKEEMVRSRKPKLQENLNETVETTVKPKEATQ